MLLSEVPITRGDYMKLGFGYLNNRRVNMNNGGNLTKKAVNNGSDDKICRECIRDIFIYQNFNRNY